MNSNNAILLCGIILLITGISNLDNFNILYEGLALSLGICAVIIFFVNREKGKS